MAQAQAAASPPPSFEAIVAAEAAKAGYTEAPEPTPAAQPEVDLGEPIPLPQDDQVDVPVPTDVKLDAVKEVAREEAPQTVPLAVHIRQRQKAEAETAELRRIIQVGSQRLDQLTRAITPPPPAEPDRNEDPLGAALSGLDQLKGQVKQLSDMTLAERQQAQVRADIESFKAAVAQDEQNYAAQVPDLSARIAYVKDLKFKEYVALGLEPQQAAARVQQDGFALASHAFQHGYSPSELISRMADTYNYRPGMTAGGESVAAGTAAANTETSAQQAVAMRAAGAERAKGGGGAPARSGPVTLQELANMDNDEFAKLTAGKKWDKLFK